MAKQTTADRLAQLMADGCPSVIEGARRMKITVVEAEKHWRSICRKVGGQAR